jgi:formate/nitrite transporter FocA (FNT family)
MIAVFFAGVICGLLAAYAVFCVYMAWKYELR